MFTDLFTRLWDVRQKMEADHPESDAPETAPKQSDAGPSQMSTSSAAIRDSTLSVSRFNRWLLSEIKRQTGDTVRDDMEHLRSQRRAANEHHQQWGASLGAASRAQMARDKQQYELLRRSNWQKGAQVRDDVEAQKSESLRLRAEWMEHGRRLAEKNQEQRGKVREATGDGCKRLTDLVAQCKLEEAEYEAELAHRRGEILRENQEEVKKVRSETADAVIDAAKQFALEQRRNQAKATKTDLSRWGAERSANTAFHLKTARTNRADAKATREHAKRMREKLQQERLQQAQAQRLAQKERITSKKANLEQIGGGLKMVTSPSTGVPCRRRQSLPLSSLTRALAVRRITTRCTVPSSYLPPRPICGRRASTATSSHERHFSFCLILSDCESKTEKMRVLMEDWHGMCTLSQRPGALEGQHRERRQQPRQNTARVQRQRGRLAVPQMHCERAALDAAPHALLPRQVLGASVRRHILPVNRVEDLGWEEKHTGTTR